MERQNSGILKPIRSSLKNKQLGFDEGTSPAGMEIEIEKPRVQLYQPSLGPSSEMEVEQTGQSANLNPSNNENVPPEDCHRSSIEFQRKRKQRQRMENLRVRESFRAQHHDEEEQP